jgi:hypothetical protein
MVPLILYYSNPIKLILDSLIPLFKCLITKLRLQILQIVQIALILQPQILQTQQSYPQIVLIHRLLIVA